MQKYYCERPRSVLPLALPALLIFLAAAAISTTILLAPGVYLELRKSYEFTAY